MKLIAYVQSGIEGRLTIFHHEALRPSFKNNKGELAFVALPCLCY